MMSSALLATVHDPADDLLHDDGVLFVAGYLRWQDLPEQSHERYRVFIGLSLQVGLAALGVERSEHHRFDVARDLVWHALLAASAWPPSATFSFYSGHLKNPLTLSKKSPIQTGSYPVQIGPII
jgi:hypothetical protein